MEIYLDANSTTAVAPQALQAAIVAMTEVFGNPSSVHGAGQRARKMMECARAKARKMLGGPAGQLVFLSGASEAIQTAVVSALTSIRNRGERGGPDLLLYGATEHLAVPQALRHWNDILKLGMKVVAIPVDNHGRHDLDWLTKHAPRAGLVCTMAVNNETGVISDLDGIQVALAHSRALWLVDGVQALGKLPLRLKERRIDYVAFSGHKLYAPKGIGLLYVREGAPLTALIAGGGQEGAVRSGTENMPAIAAWARVLDLFEDGELFKPSACLQAHRADLMAALRVAFPGVVFNADPAISIPTTINFSVPDATPRQLSELFESAALRVSLGGAFTHGRAPNRVLQVMGLAAWRCNASVRISFAPGIDKDTVREACSRILQCGIAFAAGRSKETSPEDGVSQLIC